MSLEEKIDDNNWKFEEIFTEIEEELRDNCLSEITERYKEISMGIFLRALNKKQFCIDINLFLEDYDSGDLITATDAGINNPYEFEDLCDAVYLWFEEWARNPWPLHEQLNMLHKQGDNGNEMYKIKARGALKIKAKLKCGCTICQLSTFVFKKLRAHHMRLQPSNSSTTHVCVGKENTSARWRHNIPRCPPIALRQAGSVYGGASAPPEHRPKKQK